MPISNAGATGPNCDANTNSGIIDSFEGAIGPNGDANLETSATCHNWYAHIDSDVIS